MPRSTFTQLLTDPNCLAYGGGMRALMASARKLAERCGLAWEG